MKYNASDIAMVRVTESDAHLQTSMPLIGVEQGRVHDTKLPDQAVHRPQIADNFRYALREKHVEIWRLGYPVEGVGAIFLSPLKKNGQHGIQIDDIVVMPDYRGQNLGALQMQFVSALSRARGGSFIAWECEKNNPAEKMYRAIGATPREGLIPFRLTQDTLLKAVDKMKGLPIKENQDVRFTVSKRFSMFRTINYGIEGYDMDPTQRSLGLQIEDLEFDIVSDAHEILNQVLAQYRHSHDINFVDIVVPIDSQKHLDLIRQFDAQHNSYSGNPSFLWELHSEAFERAAVLGQQIRSLDL